MSKNTHIGSMIRRMQVWGLSKDQSSQVVLTIDKWINANGIEWTVSRLKQLKVAYIRKLAGYDNPFSMTPWIAYSKAIPKGPFGPVFKLRNPQKALGALMCYTEYRHIDASPPQIKKFKEAVSSKDKSKPLEDLLSEQFSKSVQSLGNLPRGWFQKLSTWSERSIRIPVVSYQDTAPYDPIIVGTMMDIEGIKNGMSHPLAQEFLEREDPSTLPETYYNMYCSSIMSPVDFSGLEGTAGRIGFIQEPGLKLRTVANPFPVFQLCLSRLGTSLYGLLADLEEDSTFDQDKSVREVQNEIEQGRKLMSIDLSSATDRFPLRFTLAVLRQLGCVENDLWLFETLSRMEWQLPDGDRIKWQTGQPLGVYPSFAAFSLSHHVLARMALPEFYRILGDDIIIDYEAGLRIRKFYSDLSLVISEDKSLVSDRLGEFGGRLITRDFIYTQPKWREISDRSFIDLLRCMGPKGLSLLRPRQRKVAQLLAEIPETVCSFGLNWNPEGKTFLQRVSENEETINLLLSPDLLWCESGSAKRSYAIGENMVITANSDFRLGVTTHADSDHQFGDLEQWILEKFGIPGVEVFDRLITGWSLSGNIPESSDPRGYSTLVLLERKLRKSRCSSHNHT